MATGLPSQLAAADFRRRLAITLAALFLFRLGFAVNVPIQGLALERSMPVFAINLAPFLTVLFFLELIKLAFPGVKRWEAAPGNGARLQGYILLAALLVAGFQASAVVRLLEKMAQGHPPVMPDPTYTYAAIITFVAGTALVGWLMSQITLHGLGNGFWILSAAQGVDGLPAILVRCFEQIRTHAIPPQTFAIGGGFIIVSIAILAAASFPWQKDGDKTAQENGFGTSDALAAAVWPPVLALYASQMLLTLDLYLNEKPFFQMDRYTLVAETAVLILPFAAAYRARRSVEPDPNYEVKPVWLLALAQIAVLIGAQLVMLEVSLPFYINASAIIVFVAVATHLLRTHQTGTTSRQKS